ncbi:hypothetical protein O181_009731 [Austropuccinia psidii MF-1]|uniref:Uncharacterized protein n=1 Tax=Austropuccinia psidii MF-1 TaxID=1389203 RepID=A0A9Q3BSE7_9BASI|nr:hypothetical protein [Austropuccinia psidii MF-1]
MTELTEYYPTAPPTSVHCGSGILMDVWPTEEISFNISTQDLQNVISSLLGRIHVVVLGQWLPTSEVTGSSQRSVSRWTNAEGAIPVGGRPIYSSSSVPISRINTEGVVARIRGTAYFTPDQDAEGSDELDGEEVEVVNNAVVHQSSTSPSQAPAKRFKSHLIASTPRGLQPTLATIPTSLPPASPISSHTMPAMNPAVRPSPIQQSRDHPYSPLKISRRRREDL